MQENRKNTHVLLISILMLSSVFISVYLLYHHILAKYSYAMGASLCSVNTKLNCDAAAKSTYSLFLGLPISLWGLGLYSVMFLWSLLILKYPKTKSYLLYIFFLVFSGSVVYSIALAFISWLVIKVFCPFCISLYFANIATFVLLIFLLKGKLNISKFVSSIKTFIKSKTLYVSTLLFVVFVAGGFYYQTQWPYNNPKSVLFYNTYPKKLNIETNDYYYTGDVTSPVRMDIFIDFQCPFCQRAHKEINDLLDSTGLSEKVVVFYHHFPLDKKCNSHMGERVLHEDACEASRFFKALENHASLSDIFERLFVVTLKKSDSSFVEKAQMITRSFHIDEKVFEQMESDEINAELNKEITEAISWGIEETPSIFINGYFVPYKISGSEEFFRKIIEREL